jgi:hypothetical protein
MSRRRYEIKDGSGTLRYVLEFADIHDSRKLGVTNKSPNLFTVSRAMNCNVNDAAGSLICWGESFCYRGDLPDTRKGERVALRAALFGRFKGPNRQDRALIWQEYLKRRPVPPDKNKMNQKQRAKAVNRILGKLFPPAPRVCLFYTGLAKEIADYREPTEVKETK